MSVSGSTYAQQAYLKLDSLSFQTLISKRQNSGWVFGFRVLRKLLSWPIRPFYLKLREFLRYNKSM